MNKSRLANLPKELLIEIIEKQNCIETFDVEECLLYKKYIDERLAELEIQYKKEILSKLNLSEKFLTNIHAILLFGDMSVNIYRKGGNSIFEILLSNKNLTVKCQRGVFESYTAYIKERFSQEGLYDLLQKYQLFHRSCSYLRIYP